ncbi:MAG: glycosyltransferase [Planctomycetota bacterium]|nr:MAG: glycosyltransferase [Planctomycetota bacterium]REJ94168.1 MAG: glycosyltransferase [Planctomycetota bacterium]REK26354.1 MAG: glycosyltransferase [Planctomycetota bacterium]REK45905.1 MAG: glycosyltransferase [Planctomycetota bacterium]
MGRYLLREGVRMIGRPYFAMRFLPSGPRSWLQHGLRRKIFRLHHYAPRPVAVGSAYLPRVPEDKLPTISIVTPSYNQVDYLEETLQSVLNQQYPHLEYLVRDGGSTDGSREVLQRYDQQLTDWHSGPDGGQAQAVNDGLRQSRGEIMAYLNSDDLLLPGSLAYVADYFAQHPEVDVVYGHRVLINETGSEIGRWVLPAHDNETLAWVDYVPQETMFWRRRAWEAVGSTIDESFQFALDWDLILRFRAAGLRFVRLPRFLGAFRVTDTQKTSQLIDTIGRVEMNRLRREHLGRVPSRRELRRAMRPYLRRHWLLDKLYLLGAVQFE